MDVFFKSFHFINIQYVQVKWTSWFEEDGGTDARVCVGPARAVLCGLNYSILSRVGHKTGMII